MTPLFISPPPPERRHWNRFKSSKIAGLVLRCMGWQIDWHGLPAAHGVIIAYPHTSNWDFPVGLLIKWAMGIPVRFWAKDSLFTGAARFTIGPFMRYWGGIPVNRHAQSGMINDTIAHMRSQPLSWLVLAPEGTRSYTPYWRSGFYRVAYQAQVPLGLAYFNFKDKVLGATEFIQLTGDETADLARINAYYATRAHGCRPHLAGPPSFKPPAN